MDGIQRSAPRQGDVQKEERNISTFFGHLIEIQIRCCNFRVDEFEAEAKGILAVAVVAATMACRFGLSLGRNKIGSKTICNSNCVKCSSSKSFSIDAL